MTFNIDTVLKEMLDASRGQLKSDWANAKETTETFFIRRKKRLKKLADDRITGKINDQEFQEFIEVDKILLSDELLALEIISKAAVQKAVNAALGVLYNAIEVAMKLL